jgi:nicotinate-nucleotide adenylyltransferase
VGHLLLAQEARWQLGLDRVLLMVTRQAPHKEIEDDPGAQVRLEMAMLAAEDEDGVQASGLEVGRDEISYSWGWGRSSRRWRDSVHPIGRK